MRMSANEYRAWNAKKLAKVPKFRNVKKVVNGLEFDSMKEARRHADLVLMQQSKQITNLERQKEYRLEVNEELICTYIADFTYVRYFPGPNPARPWVGAEHKTIVEDVKSKATRKLPVYAIKKKLMRAIHGIEIQEI